MKYHRNLNRNRGYHGYRPDFAIYSPSFFQLDWLMKLTFAKASKYTHTKETTKSEPYTMSYLHD